VVHGRRTEVTLARGLATIAPIGFIALLVVSALVPASESVGPAPVPGAPVSALHGPVPRSDELTAPLRADPPTAGVLPPGPIRSYRFASVALDDSDGTPTWLAYDAWDRSFYVAQSNSTVAVIPQSEDSQGDEAATLAVGTAPFGVAYDPTDSRVFVTNSGSDSLSVISDQLNATIGTVPVGAEPYGIAFDPDLDRLFVANGGSDTLSVVDAATWGILASVSVGAEPVGVAFDPVSSDIFVANEASSTVSVISTATDTVVGTVPVPAAPYGVAVDNSSGDVYVSDSQSGDVSVLTASGNATVATLAVGGTPEGLAYDWQKQTVWVADGIAWVVVINASQNKIVQDLFFDPRGAAFDPDNGEVCFTNAANGTFQCVVPWDGYSSITNLTFNESGLPAGTMWAVSITTYFDTDLELSSDSPTLVFQVYPTFGLDFSVLPLTGYASDPSTGMVQYTSDQNRFNITFRSAPGNYTVTFLESGLGYDPWSAVVWGVEFAGTPYSGVAGSIVVPAVNGTYPYSAVAPAGYTAPSASEATILGGDLVVELTYVSAAFAVEFQETGLPADHAWAVDLGGTEVSSGTQSIEFDESDGNCPFTIEPEAGWATAPYSGEVTVAGEGLTLAIPWIETQGATLPTYMVDFQETGLPNATEWAVSANSSWQETNSAGLSFFLPNGSFPFVVTTNAAFAPVPSEGTVPVQGASVTVLVRFSPTNVTLIANFSYQVDSASCEGSALTNAVTVYAAASGGTPPYLYVWYLPTGDATGPVANTTLTSGGGAFVALTVSDAAGGVARHFENLSMDVLPCPILNSPPFVSGPGLDVGTDAILLVAVTVGVAGSAIAGSLLARKRPPQP
jgi:YVTN family beta-propeller protein